MQMDYYSILGVSKESLDTDIKAAYRKLAMKHHPDRGGDQAEFQKIQEAYAVLSDPQKRQQYNNPRQHHDGFEFHFGGGNPFEDLFSQFGFAQRGHDPFAHMRQQQRRNRDLRIRINIKLADTLQPHSKTVSVQTTNGERQTVQVEIPRGVTTGSSIKYSGLGDNMFATIPRGDLYVTFVVEEDPLYQIHGIDLIYTCHIDCVDAMLGVDCDIPSIEGRVFNIAIPPGTQTGAKFRIPNQGLYSLEHNGAIRGSLIVQVNVTIPKVLNETQKELLRQFKTS
jgi:curved DNA-binding protein